MNKKIDINKLLSTGSAKQRAVLLFYHFNLKEVLDKGMDIEEHILPFTDAEAKTLFNSFKENKEIKIYNEYRDLNIQIIQAMKWLLYLIKSFEVTYWKCQTMFLLSKHEREYKFDTVKNLTDLHRKILKEKNIEYLEGATDILENVIINDYVECINYYSALKIYIKKSGYKDKHIISTIDKFYKTILADDRWVYFVINGDKQEPFNLSEIEPDKDDIKDILKLQFNIDYENEED